MRTTRRRILIAATAALAAGAGLARAGEEAAKGAPPPAADRFAVHEWGTFTSVHGSDGVALEGLTREEEALPSFVYDRTEVRDCPLRAQGWKGLEVPAERVTRKMETPVIYFHSATDRRVRVRVDFAKGLLTQWYPVSDLLGPPEGANGAAPLDVSKIDRSFLAWDVDVLAKGASQPAEVPAVAKDDPWQFARDVDASWVRTRPREAPDRAGPVEAERYLFYRGLGAFPLPLTVTPARGGKLRVRNSGDVAIPFVLPFEVRGDRMRIGAGGPVPVRGDVTIELPADDWGPLDRFAEKLASGVDDLLRKHGLHDDEARAMVRTWSRSWFRSEGTRVIWIVPRPTTDAILPLAIDPKPDEFVRVLVGRSEVIPPEVEDEDYAALLDTAGKDAAAAERGMAVLARRDRFLEPHLRNVVASVDRRAKAGAPLVTDGTVRARASGWLDKIRTEHASLPGRETPFAR